MWTNNQRRAIETRGENLLVSAGAGSGKTAVLTARILELIREGASIEHMLIVTFTRAAAAEMRERITQRLEEEEGDERFAREAMLAERAHIQTLHGFCTSLLREHFGALSLPAGFRVMDAGEAKALLAEVMDETLDAYYEQYGDAAHDADARLGGVDAFRDALVTLHTFLMGMPEPACWLEEALDKLSSASASPLESPYAAVLLERAHDARDAARALLDDALAHCRKPGGPIEYERALLDDLDQLDAVFNTGAAPAFTRLPTRSSAPPERKEAVKALRDEAKDLIRQLAESPLDARAARANLDAAMPALTMLACAWRMFKDAFAARKREAGALDFNDLEHYAREALCIDAVRDSVRARFEHVFVDEYQDTSALQEDIIERVSGGNNLFAVGDIKQSIYRFRQADPSIFATRFDSYRGGDGGTLVHLSDNFRSRGQVLSAVNHIFGGCMRRETCGVEYADGHALKASRERKGPNVGVVLLDAVPAPDATEEQQELSGIQLEAAHAARYIQARVTSGSIDTGDGPRPVRYSDIVILLRSPRGRAEAFTRALDEWGVPSMADAADAARLMPEVRAVLALLRAVDNARDDEAVIGALSGMGFTSDDIARVRLANRDAPLKECLRLCALSEGMLADKSAAFLERLSMLRERTRWETPGAFVRYVAELFTQDGVTAALPGGEARKSSLELLCARAEAYDSTPGRTLYDFLTDLGDALSPREDLSPTQLLLSDNVVRVMSIHKSKGLEFPIVIVAGMGAKFNKRDIDKPLLLDRTLGIGMRCVDPDSGKLITTIAHEALSLNAERQLNAEEMRILYVAMTRAREELVLLGAVINAKKAAVSWARPQHKYALNNAARLFDYVMPALMRHPDGVQLRALCGGEDEEFGGTLGDTSARYDITVYDRSGVLLGGGAAEEQLDYAALLDEALTKPPSDNIAAVLAYEYPRGAVSGMPLKLSVSDMVKSKDAAVMTDKPRFAVSRVSAAQRGNATHKVLSMLDFAHLKEADGRGTLGQAILGQLDGFLSARRLDAYAAETADIAGIEGFFNSQVGRDALESPLVLREQPFNMRLPLSAYMEGASDAPFLVQGVIDLCYLKDEQWVLVDFKTDRVHGGDTDAILDRYRPQVLLYKRALMEATGREVRECYIALLSIDNVFRVDC